MRDDISLGECGSDDSFHEPHLISHMRDGSLVVPYVIELIR